MFRVSPSKKTSKPSALALAKYAAKFKATIEFDLQSFKEDKNFEDQLRKIISTFQHIEKSLTNKTGEPEGLAKEFQKSEEALEKIVTKLQHVQEHFHNCDKTLNEKLVLKLKDVKPPEKSNSKAYDESKKRVELIIKEVEALLVAGKQKVSELHDLAQAALKFQKGLKPMISKFLLPECITQCEKQAKKLLERLEYLCKISVGIDLSKGPAANIGIEIDKINGTVPQLGVSLKTCGQLFDQAMQNLKPKVDQLVVFSGGAIAVHGFAAAGKGTGAAAGSDPDNKADKDKPAPPLGAAQANESLLKFAS